MENKAFYEMQDVHRVAERTRLISSMELNLVNHVAPTAYPLSFDATHKQASAFIELLLETTPKGQLGLIILGEKSLEVHPGLYNILKENGEGFFIRVAGPATACNIKTKDATCEVDFGYSSYGFYSRLDVSGITYAQPYLEYYESVVRESLLKMFEFTGKVDFITTLADIEKMRAGVQEKFETSVDSNGYFEALGLNPFAVKSIAEPHLDLIIKGIKREVTRNLHTDTGSRAYEDTEFLKRVLEACDVLGDRAKRYEYITW